MKLDPRILGRILVCLAPSVAAAQTGPNLVINGDFENHTGSGCQYNFQNANFGLAVPNSTAFGASSEIDLMSGACYGPVAISGTTKVGLNTKPTSLIADEFSLDLSSPVLVGGSYELRFWVLPELTFTSSIGRVRIGLSASPTSMGSLVFTTPQPLPGQWTQFVTLIIAPINATCITVSSGAVEGWTHVDGVELRSAGCNPGPVTYCTAKMNSIGCVPSISSTGCASASHLNAFVVSASQVRNQKVGLLLYGSTGRWSVPFSGGFLCVFSPIKRTGGVSSGGTPLPASDCSGVFSIDMNAFAAGAYGGTPLPALSVQGTTIDCEWWGRDPGFPSPNNLTLSNALEYVVGF